MSAQQKRPEREGSRAHGTGNQGKEASLDYNPPVALSTRRRWAPYGTRVMHALAAGRFPNVYLFAGPDAWQRAEQRMKAHGEGSTLVLPDGEPPESFRWPPLDGLLIVANGEPLEMAERIARAVCADGTRYACAVYGSGTVDPVHCWHEDAERDPGAAHA